MCAGCATQRPIPSAYFPPTDTAISVQVSKISEKPVLRDSGGGGLLGMALSSSLRGGAMRESLEGLQGSLVHDLVKQELENVLGAYFVVEEESRQLQLDVAIDSWGWFVPSTVLGIRAGSYQFEIAGKATVRDASERRKTVGYVQAITHLPLGGDPETADAQAVVTDAAKDFSRQVLEILLKKAPPSET